MNTKRLKMIFLGTGSAFATGNYHSNILLEKNARTLLIDCGTDARHSLKEMGFSAEDIDDVYISHLHADHAGGLEWLGFVRKFNPTTHKPILHISEKLMTKLWNKSLSGGMTTLEEKKAALEDFFDTHPIGKELSFNWNNIHFQLFQTLHVKNNGRNVPSFGLHFHTGGQHILITTDTIFEPEYMHLLYETADIIFQDCEIETIRSGVHANYVELRTLDSSIKKKMWLYHYGPGKLPDAKKDGFAGFVKKGQLFLF